MISRPCANTYLCLSARCLFVCFLDNTQFTVILLAELRMLTSACAHSQASVSMRRSQMPGIRSFDDMDQNLSKFTASMANSF